MFQPSYLSAAGPHGAYGADDTSTTPAESPEATESSDSESSDPSIFKTLASDPEVRKWAGTTAKQGLNSMVAGVRSGAARKEQLIAIAQQLGVPDAAEFPGFTVRAVKKSTAWRARKARHFKKVVDRLERKGKRNNRWKKDKSKLAILAIAEQMQQAEQAGKLPASNVTLADDYNENVEQAPVDTTTDLTYDKKAASLTPEVDHTWYYVGGTAALAAAGFAVWWFKFRK